tara:strand:- start:482 stop:673 length:192 start_codon:yes stop_codon:yes gene_type:complete
MGKFIYQVQEVVENNAFESFDVITDALKVEFAPNTELFDFAKEVAYEQYKEICSDMNKYSNYN